MPSNQNEEDIDFGISIGSGFKRVRGFLRMTPIAVDHSSTPGGAKSVPVVEEVLPSLPEVFPVDEILDQESAAPNDIFVNKSFFNIYSIIVAQDGTGDFESIQEALDNIASTGGTVFIKEGTYTENLTLSSNIALVGQGFSSYINGIISLGSGDSGIIIRNLRFKKVDVGSFSNLKILDCFCFNESNAAIALNSVEKIIISGNFFDTVSGGIDVLNVPFDLIVSSNIFKSAGTAIHFSSGNEKKYAIFESNLFISCGTGIFITNSAEGVIISNNIMRDGGVGIQVEDGSLRIIVSGNECFSNSTYGIRFIDVDRSIITSNICLSNTTANLSILTSTNIVNANNITT